MEKRIYVLGERVDKRCTVCGGERGHVVASISKRGSVTRVSCPVCGTRSAFKSTPGASATDAVKMSGPAYDPKRTYRTGQTMTHPSFGAGEVTSLIEPQKIDVLFSDRLRRLIHARF